MATPRRSLRDRLSSRAATALTSSAAYRAITSGAIRQRAHRVGTQVDADVPEGRIAASSHELEPRCTAVTTNNASSHIESQR